MLNQVESREIKLSNKLGGSGMEVLSLGNIQYAKACKQST
tara:strand:+ start:414 stop:533 length:120 start_codon:yes stop_codon:yes gene_type:complete